MKNMVDQAYKKIIVVLVFSTLSACSVVGGLWYERIDQLIANQFLEYASFTNDQEKYVRQATLEFKYWNIKNELPKYKKLLSQFKALDNTTTFDDIDDIYQQGMILGNNTRDFFLPQIVEFCKTITNKQVEEMATYFDELMKERKLELENDEDDFRDSLAKMSLISKGEVEMVKELITAAGLPIEPPNINANEFITAMKSDKKVKERKIQLVLLKKIGEAFLTSDYSEEDLLEVLGG